MSLKFLSDDTFIDRPEIYTRHIVENCLYIILIQLRTKNADIIHIQFQQIFHLRFGQRIFRVADRMGGNRYA